MRGFGRARLTAGIALLAALPAWAEDIVQVLRAARAYDAVYASARASLQAGRERLPQGRAGLLPVISATANETRSEVDNRTIGRQFGFTSYGYSVTLSQPIYRPANWAVYQQGELQVWQAEANFGQAGQDLILRTAQAYFDVLAAEDTLRFIQAQKVAISEQLAQAKRNFEVGTATITDTNEAQARYDLAVAQEIAAQNDLEVRRNAIAQITGQVYPRLVPLAPQAQIAPPQPNDMSQWVRTALDNSFTVRAQEATWEIARREVDRNRAGHLPALDIVASSGRNVGGNAAISGIRTDLIQSQIGLQLSVPIYAGGGIESRVREAVANQERARSDLDNTRRTAEFNTRQSFLSLSNGIAQVRALEQSLASSQTALASNRLGYEVGVRINIDVLNAQQQVFQTLRDLSRARYDTILNGLRLKSAAGILTDVDIAEVNRLLGNPP